MQLKHSLDRAPTDVQASSSVQVCRGVISQRKSSAAPRRASVRAYASSPSAYADELRETAKYISRRGRGILASDESNATTGKRLDSVSVDNTETNRCCGHVFFGVHKFLSILHSLTDSQWTADGTGVSSYTQLLASANTSQALSCLRKPYIRAVKAASPLWMCCRKQVQPADAVCFCAQLCTWLSDATPCQSHCRCALRLNML